MMDYLHEMEQAAIQADRKFDRRAEEYAELLDIRNRLTRLSESTAEDGHFPVYMVANMINLPIMDRCPHDPAGYVVKEKHRHTSRGKTEVSYDVTCLHCNAKTSRYETI